MAGGWVGCEGMELPRVAAGGQWPKGESGVQSKGWKPVAAASKRMDAEEEEEERGRSTALVAGSSHLSWGGVGTGVGVGVRAGTRVSVRVGGR
jgi:hypothetical protein